MGFDILAIASASTGKTAAFQIKGMVKNLAGTVSLLPPTVVNLAADEGAGGWTAKVEADNAKKAVLLKVKGAADTWIRWVASLRTAEVVLTVPP